MQVLTTAPSLACRYVEEMCRLFKENAAACLPAAVAARGLEVHRIGHGLVRHAKL